MTACRILGVAILLCLTAGGASAQEKKSCELARTDWCIYAEQNPNHCWVVSAPKKQLATRDGRPVAVSRSAPYLFVSFRPESKDVGEVSFYGGYPFAKGSTVTLEVGGNRFEMFTEGEHAWAASADDDRKIATALKRGAESKVIGRSARGNTTTDTFSLMGFTAAYDDARKRCSN